MQFWLGTHLPSWLGIAGVPLMVSVRRLAKRRTYPRARAVWWQDSGGFTELALFGQYQTTPQEYVAQTRRHAREVGRLAFVSPQDWMCEPSVRHKTGLSVAEHQRHTIDSLLELRALAPEIAWLPVLQGWQLPEYVAHVEQYAVAGIDLRREPLVGVGTVCRRQATREGVRIMQTLSGLGLRLHGFGLKTLGLRAGAEYLRSADSLAWSYTARRERTACEDGHQHLNCANCLGYALRWRDVVLASFGRATKPIQLGLAWT